MSYETIIHLENELCEHLIIASEDYPDAKYNSSTLTCDLDYMVAMCVQEWLDSNKRVLAHKITIAEHDLQVAQSELDKLRERLSK